MEKNTVTPLVHFQVETDGTLSLVMAKEVFDALATAIKSPKRIITEPNGSVRVSVNTVEAKISVPVKTDTGCQP